MKTSVANSINAFYCPKERLRVTIDGIISHPTVKPVWSSPLTLPDRYLSLLNAKGEEIVMIDSLDQIDNASREAIDRELRLRYLTCNVTEVLKANFEYGATYWLVQTDRGQREFVTQHLQENAIWFSDTHLLLLDVDGNRFEITDTNGLSAHGRKLISSIL